MFLKDDDVIERFEMNGEGKKLSWLVKAVPISLFRRTKGSADHVFQRGNDFHQESDVRQNSCMCHKSRHFGRPSEGSLSSHGLD